MPDRLHRLHSFGSVSHTSRCFSVAGFGMRRCEGRVPRCGSTSPGREHVLHLCILPSANGASLDRHGGDPGLPVTVPPSVALDFRGSPARHLDILGPHRPTLWLLPRSIDGQIQGHASSIGQLR